MKLMFQYVKKYKGIFLLNIFCVFGFIIIEIGLPTIFAQIINNGLLYKNMDYVKQMVVFMVIIALAGLGGLLMQSFCIGKITSNVIRDIRDDVFVKIQTFSHKEYDEFGVARLITSTTNDPFQIMMFLQTFLRTGFMAPMMFIASIVMVILKSPSLSVYLLAALPLLIIGVLWIGKHSGPLSEKQQSTLDSVNMNLRESLSGLRVIRAFVREDFQEERFDTVNVKYAEVSKKLFKLMALAMPAFYFIFYIVVSLIIWSGGNQIQEGLLQVGDISAFIEYIFHALFSFSMFAIVFTMYPRAAVSTKRIQEILDVHPVIENNEKGITQTKTKGFISFKNVSFAYAGEAEEPVLRNISFHARPGQTVAIIGSTGSGKSTLIQLIPRFYDVTKGQIIIDGVDVRDYELKTLRDKIGFIPQKALLFTGTISENIRYGKESASMDEMQKAADIAQASEFINNKENTYEAFLAEGGSNMSGGQKQRLSIARAVIKKPDIYIFDDSFSALDFKTDAALRARLKQETRESTVIIVAQRVGTIMHADKILVLNEGNIVGEGTHKELLKCCPIYYDIAASQLSKEELAE